MLKRLEKPVDQVLSEMLEFKTLKTARIVGDDGEEFVFLVSGNRYFAAEETGRFGGLRAVGIEYIKIDSK